MSKITTGFIGIIAVLVVATGIGFALFSSTATVTGLDLVTATPGLLISPDPTAVDYSSTMDFTALGLSFAPLVPGEYDWGEFWLMNDSNGETAPVDFIVTGQIMSAGGDWDTLKDVIKVRICHYDDVADLHCDLSMATDWYTLAQWLNNPKEVDAELLEEEEQHYAVNLMLDPSAGNEVSGMMVDDVEFDFVGTQITEVTE